MMEKLSVIRKNLPRKSTASCGPLYLLLGSLVLLILGGCANRSPRNLLDGTHAGPMAVSIATTLAPNGNPRPEVMVSIPQSALVFKRQGHLIEAGFEVSVSAFSGRELVGGGVAAKKITVPGWDAMDADSLVSVRVPLKLSSTEKIVLEVRARSLHSSRYWNHRLAYEAGGWTQVPLSLLEFHVGPGNDRLIRQDCDSLKVELLVQEISEDLTLDSQVSADQWWISVGISPTNGQNTSHQKTLVRRGQATNPLLLSFNICTKDIPFGDVVVTPLLLAGVDDSPASSPWRHDYPLQNIRINFADSGQWEDQMLWLEGKASGSALADLVRAPVGQRQKLWDMFWATNGPILTVEGELQNQKEHLLLIIEADRRFTHGQRGSHTPRGKALIRYGNPGRIDKVGDTSGRDECWETWNYLASGLKLIFQDPHGLGDFMLVEEIMPRPVGD